EAAEQSKTRIRIGRACDRCKLKKSKCDGNNPCSGCKASDSVCEYSARRRREARDWYWEMRDIVDEALQSLYWACREGRGFPGVIPDESNGHVSTDAILRGLGFVPPVVEPRTGSGHASHSALDDAGETPERSYHPPDVLPHRRSTNSSIVAQVPLAGTPESPILEDRNGQQKDQLDHRGFQRNTPVHGPGSISLHPQLGLAMESDIDSAMFHDGDIGTANVDRARSSTSGIPNFRLPTQMKDNQHYLLGGLDPKVQESGIGADHGPLNKQDGRWEDQSETKSGEMLPWPGTLAAVSRNARQNSSG
ncbi:uncharacterized protein A1O9_02971, partial [Exophiala aquamarina CBS 119918]